MEKNTATQLDPGMILNELEIISYVGMKSNRQRYECECSCGELFIAYKEHLLSGRTKKCPYCTRAKDLRGMESGNWIAERRAGKNPAGAVVWQCYCQVCNRKAFFESSEFLNKTLPICSHE